MRSSNVFFLFFAAAIHDPSHGHMGIARLPLARFFFLVQPYMFTSQTSLPLVGLFGGKGKQRRGKDVDLRHEPKMKSIARGAHNTRARRPLSSSPGLWMEEKDKLTLLPHSSTNKTRSRKQKKISTGGKPGATINPTRTSKSKALCVYTKSVHWLWYEIFIKLEIYYARDLSR